MANSRRATFRARQSLFSDKTAYVYDFDDYWNYRTRSILQGGGLDLKQADQVFQAYEKNPYIELLTEVQGGNKTRTVRDNNPYSSRGPREVSTRSAVGIHFAKSKQLSFNKEGTFMGHGNDPFSHLREKAFRDRKDFAGYETEDFLGHKVAKHSTKELRKDKDIIERVASVNQVGNNPYNKQYRTTYKNVTHKVGSDTFEDAWKRANEATFGGTHSADAKAAKADAAASRRQRQYSPHGHFSTQNSLYVGGKRYANQGLANQARRKAANKDPTFSLSGLEEGDENFVTKDNLGFEVNKAFLSDELYSHEKFTGEHASVFGLTVDQAVKQSPLLDAANQIMGAGSQGFSARLKAKSKEGSFFKKALGFAAPIIGNLVLPGIGGAIGGALGGALQGGGIGDILKGGALGFLGGKGAFSNALGKVGLGNFANTIGNTGVNALKGGLTTAIQGGDFGDILKSGLGGFLSGGAGKLNFGKGIWSQGGGALSNAGPVQILQHAPQGAGGNMGLGSFLGDMFSSGKKLFSGGLGDILKGGLNVFAGGTSSDIFANILGGGAKILLDHKQRSSQQKAIDRASDRAVGLADPGQAYRGAFAGQLGQLMTDPSYIKQRPSYQFAMSEGLEAVNRRMAARGHARSGNLYHELMNRASGIASQEFGAEANRLGVFSGLDRGAFGTAGQIAQGQGDRSAALTAGRYGTLADVLTRAGRGMF